MSRDRQTIGGCPKCKSATMTCTYNHFQNDELEIHSWEHKCPDCGHRETSALRSDEEDDAEDFPHGDKCPYCGRIASM
ncbi:hypothetical protein [Blastopirellula retiformator]|uniref:Uncharacterized protein n=1 Tax=Blastopirellula retiformator TaxID=2527970 RepID=A0A5C5V0J9_9BACT|nr:hypothetical protein [Blastopirellula retiformator]TWT31911.1 hypothetical protein Enr8_38370 [Blastopirellula retiformator]